MINKFAIIITIGLAMPEIGLAVVIILLGFLAAELFSIRGNNKQIV